MTVSTFYIFYTCIVAHHITRSWLFKDKYFKRLVDIERVVETYLQHDSGNDIRIPTMWHIIHDSLTL